MSEKVKKEDPKLQLKNVTSSRDLLLELGKKEASKPMYLTRYE